MEAGEVEATHYLVEHKGEMVWNRRDRLKLITTDTGVRSKILAGAQKPTRLANGAIAKGIGGVSLKSPSFNNSTKSTTDSTSIIDGGTKGNYMTTECTPHSTEHLNHPITIQAQLSSSITQQNPTSPMYQDTICSPEKRTKPDQQGLVSHQRTLSSGSSSSSYSGKTAITTVNVAPANQEAPTKGALFKNLL